MVAVRSAHINKAGEFDPKKWIASLGISSQQSCERLAETSGVLPAADAGASGCGSAVVAWRGDG